MSFSLTVREMGDSVSNGTYLYTINGDNFSATRKMLIRK